MRVTKGIFSALAGCGVLAALCMPVRSGAQSSAADTQTVNKLIQEVQDQQKTIIENQAKIDEGVAKVTEAVRVARIFTSRGGR